MREVKQTNSMAGAGAGLSGLTAWACAALLALLPACAHEQPARMTTPRANDLIARHLGAPLTAVAVEMPVLRWRKTGLPGQLARTSIACGGAPVVLYLHPRSGTWFDDGHDAGAARFLGVIEDALVFAERADQAAECVRPLLSSSQGARPLEAFDDAGLGAGLARAPRLDSLGVLEWGPFPHAIPPEAAAHAFALVSEATTVILRSISAEAVGPRETRIGNRR